MSFNNVSLRFGGPPLLDGVNLHIQEGDRLCLLGRNGTGKSSLLRLVAGVHTPDGGSLSIRRDTRVSYLDQETGGEFSGSAADYCRETGAPELESGQYLTRLGVDPASSFAQLSGGGRRRVMLAAVLAQDADVVLLDEPTNHLDIDSIAWLEDHLLRRVKTFVLVTHDRAFARAVSNRVAELDRGELFAFDCGFDDFLRRRDELAVSEDSERALFDKRLAQEEAWLRRGTKARRTRDEGRVRALMKMREEYAERRTRAGQVNLRVQDAGRSGNIVIETTDLTFAYPEAGASLSGAEVQPTGANAGAAVNLGAAGAAIVEGLTTTILRGDKVGIVGPNGVGKTTLIRVLLGELQPQSGTVRTGTNLKATYFDQIRSTLDPERNVIENLSDGDDMVVIGGRSKHVKAYLADFLFEPDRLRSPVGVLSGGERNRLLLAKLFLQPSNLLIMDEPTNDLDLETLELLEEMLLSYKGTLLLVSHDRDLLDNVVTDCLVFTGPGRVEELAGGYSDWGERVSASATGNPSAEKAPPLSAASSGDRGKNAQASRKPRDRVRKLSFKETRELEQLPGCITELEGEIERLHARLADPELYRSGGGTPAALTADLREKEEQLSAAFERWEELEAIEHGGQG